MIEKMADAVGVSPQAFIAAIVVIAVFVIIFLIKMHFDEKKGVNSQEKGDIRKLIDNLVPDGTQYMAAYAHSKEVYGSRTMRREVYHYYAVGFRPTQADHIWVIPIGVENGKIVYTQAARYDTANLAYVGGNEFCLQLHFPGVKDVCALQVEESNTKFGKECQVNIQQPEEAEAFRGFAKAFQERINTALGVNHKGKPLKK